MDFTNLALAAVILVTFTSLVLLVSRDWRISLAALTMQYVGVFILVALEWPMTMAAVKLLAGWMAGAVLAMNLIGFRPAALARSGERPVKETEVEADKNRAVNANRLSGQVFRLLAATLVGIVVISVAPNLTEWLPNLTLEQAWGGLILAGIGLLQLGFTTQPLYLTLGLLTVFSGFEVIYATIEPSVLLAGLLAAATLGLALTGSYLVSSPQMEDVN